MKAGDCRHFRGIQHDTCKVGVAYAEIGDDSKPGMATRLPCITTTFTGRSGPVAGCQRFEALTQEEENARSMNANNTGRDATRLAVHDATYYATYNATSRATYYATYNATYDAADRAIFNATYYATYNATYWALHRATQDRIARLKGSLSER